MVCKYCGAEIFNNAKFCQKCGRGVDGKVNPSKKEKAKAQFEKEIRPICRRFSETLDNSRELDPTYVAYKRALDEMEKVDKKTVPLITLPLIVTLILAAIFSVLIPGLNFDNENFQWILKGRSLALVLCSSTSFIPFYALCQFFASLYDQNVEFTLGDLGRSVCIGLVGGVVMTLVLGFLNGFFGDKFVPACIVLAVILVIVAVVLIVYWVRDSGSRESLGAKQAAAEKLREAYENKFAHEIKPFREKYKDILSDDELDNCVIKARSAQATENLKEITETLHKMRGE